MKKNRLFHFIAICFMLQMNSLIWAQTILLSPSGDGGFENGSTFEANGWTVSNSLNNPWIVKPLSNGLITGNAAFISSNGTSPSYGTSSIASNYFWRDITVPAGESGLSLSFNWIANGESTYDLWQVFVAPTTVNPVGVVSYPGSGATLIPSGISGATWVANGNLQTNTQTANVVLPTSLIGTTFRLIFYWKNDESAGYQAPAQIDNIKLMSFSAMTGIYSIDKSIPESITNFNSFNSAIEALNMRGISGSVTFNVAAGQTFNENLSALTATGTASNTITFQKSGVGNNPKIVPTGVGSTDYGICISGGDYITFDGIDIDGSSATNSTNAIEFGYLIRNVSGTNGAQYNTIKNCSVTLNKNFISTAANACIFTSVSSTQGGVTPTAVSGANSYNKFYNLTLNNAQNGIYAVGNSTYPDLSCEFGVSGTGCQTVRNSISNIGGVFSGSAYGVYNENQSSSKIFNFDISNIRSNGTSNISIGILSISFKGTSDIFNNKISDISSIGTSSTGRVVGIELQNSTGTPTIRVYNNFIYDIKSSFTGTATSSIYVYGIYCNNTSVATISEIDNNNVFLSVASGTPTYSSSCFGIASTSAVHKVRGNIFVNTFPNQTTANHVAWYSASTTSVGASGSISNYNDLYVSGTNGFIGRGGSTTYATLSNWQGRTGTPDLNSISIDPSFTSSTDLHVTAAGLSGISGFTPQSWITTDFDCDPIGGTYRIGADAPSGSACTTPTDQASNLQFTSLTSSSLQGSFSAGISAPSGYLVVRSTSNTLSSTPVNSVSYSAGDVLGGGVVVQSSANTTFTQSSLNSNTTYYYFVFSYNNSGCSGGPLYNTTSPLSNNITTCLATPSTPTFSGIGTSEMTVNWEAVTGASSYSLEVSTNVGFTTPIVGSPFNVNDTSKLLTDLVSGTTYYVRLTALGGNCNSAISGIANTNLLCSIPSAQPTSLSFTSVTATSFSSSFTAALGSPTGYVIVRSTNSTLSANPINGTTYTSGGSLGGGTIVQVGATTSFSQSSLTANTTYYYFIFSYNNTNCSGGPVYNTISPLTGAITTCLSGSPATPMLSNETTSSMLVSWSAFTGATSYRLDVSTGSSFVSFVSGYQDLVVNGTSITISGLSPNTLYYVRVRAHNESCPSSNSFNTSKTTLKIEPTNQPTNLAAVTVTTSSISLGWTAAVSGGQSPDGYLIKASATSLESTVDPVDGIDPTDVSVFTSNAANKKQTTGSSTGTTSFTGMMAGTMYYYKIYSYTNSGSGIDFKTDNVPTLYNATQPNNSGTPTFTSTPLNSSQATISWTAPTGFDASKHKILVFVKSGSTAISTTSLTINPTSFVANTVLSSGTVHPNDATAYCVYNGDGTSVTISGLTGNTTYQVRVLIGMLDVNSNGTYTYSSGTTTSGTTLKAEPTNQATAFSVGTVSTTNIPLSWTAAVAGSQAPDGYLIKGSATSLASISDPTDGTDPGSGSLTFSSGASSYKSTSTSGTFTGHSAGTMYYYKIYSYTNSGTGIDFKTNNVPTLNHATTPVAHSSLVFNTTLSNSATISWSKPASYSNDNHTTLVFVKSGTAVVTGTPTFAPSYYTASSVFSFGTAYQGDAAAYCVYKGDDPNVTITGLNGNTTYHFYIVTVVDSTNSNGSNSYSPGLSANKTTSCNPVDSFNLTFEDTSSLPLCTSFLSTDLLGANIQSGTSNYPYQGTRCLGLQTNTIYILPNISNAHLNSHQISFYARTFLNTTGQIGFGYLTDPTNAATYVNLQTFNLNNTYKYCSYIPSGIPQNAYIAVKLLTSSVLRVDNIVWELGPIPSITSSLTAITNIGESYNYSIVATNSPTSYTATGLPAGLSIDTTTGVISGTPTESGTFNVSISAINVSGEDVKTLELMVIPTTTLSSRSCGGTLSAATSFVYATTVPGVSAYGFQVTYNDTVYDEVVSNDYRFRLSEVTGLPLVLGATYSVRVRVYRQGQPGAFGATCTVNTPSVAEMPTTTLGVQSCGTTLSATTSFIYAASVVGVSAYGFKVTYNGTAYPEVVSNDYRFRLSEVSGLPLLFGAEYSIQVRIYANGQEGLYGSACTVTTPSIPETTLGVQSCGATLSATTSFIYAASVVGASAYGFKVTYNGTAYPEVVSNDYRFRLSEVSGLPLLFGAEYSIQVRIYANGQEGLYGSACTVTTPSIPETTLGVQSCGATLSATTSFIYAASVVGASAYGFEVTYNGTAYEEVISNDYRFRLSEVSGLPLFFGAEYGIKVRIYSNGQHGLYGSSCTVSTPGLPTSSLESSQCGTTILHDNLINATPVTGASGYKFNVYNAAGTTLVTSYESATNSFNFRDNITGYTFNTTYQIRVQVLRGSEYGVEGTTCTVTVIKESARTSVVTEPIKDKTTTILTELKAYPNPFTSTFNIAPIEGETETLFYQVYDVTGKMIESQSVEANNVQYHTIGDVYPEGMYLVIVRQGATTQTFKMVKQ